MPIWGTGRADRVKLWTDVSRGYGSPPPSQCHEQLNAQNSTFASETQILQSVKNTRNAWNRTKSAPMYSNELIPFCGLRADIIEHVHQQDENEDPKDLTMAIKNNQAATSDESIGFMDLKRNRDEIFQDWANEEADSPSAMQVDNKVIAALPRRHDPSFHSSSSSSSPFVRHRTLPISSNLSSYLSSAQDSNIDFSSFTNRSDF